MGCVPGSQIATFGKVMPGHELVACGGRDVQNLTFDDIQAFVLSCVARPLPLVFRNPHAVPAAVADVRVHGDVCVPVVVVPCCVQWCAMNHRWWGDRKSVV